MSKLIYSRIEGYKSLERAHKIYNCHDLSNLRELAIENKENNIVSYNFTDTEIRFKDNNNTDKLYNKFDTKSIIPDSISLMHIAAKNGDYEVVKYLLSQGYDVDLKTYCIISTWHTYEVTPLHLASMQGHTAVVEQLIKVNANINAECFMVFKGERRNTSAVEEVFMTGFTPLHFAVKFCRLDCIDLLDFYGAKLSCWNKIFARNNLLANPSIFHTATMMGQIDSIDLLLELYKKKKLDPKV